MRHIPPIKAVMTPFPYSVDIDDSVSKAKEIMMHQQIRHLPVKAKDKLVGIITDRDIKLMLGPDFAYPPERRVIVRDVYIEHAYTVDLNEPLDNVLMHMAEHHIGSAIVTRNGKLAGLFTVTDACRCFAEHLRDQFRPSGGDDAA